MKRLAFAAWFVLLAAGAVWANDIVYYTDPATKKEKDVTGVIDQETPAGIKIKVGRKVETVSAGDVRMIVYDHKDVSAIEFRRPYFTKEQNALKATRPADRDKLLGEALLGYQELDGKVRELPNAHRFLQYKIAQVKALRAGDDPAKRDAAIEALIAYKKEFPTGWEIVPALRLLAQLQEAKGDAAGQAQTYADLAEVPGLSEALKLETQLTVARLLLRAGKYDEASDKLKSAEAVLPANDSNRALVDVYLLQVRIARKDLNGVEDRLKAALAAAKTDSVRGVAHNLLGDYYRLRNQNEPAFWEYLKVETLYNQDKEENAKALFYLAELFDKVKNDKVRAAECLTKLKGTPFAGTMFQRRAESEKKTP